MLGDSLDYLMPTILPLYFLGELCDLGDTLYQAGGYPLVKLGIGDPSIRPSSLDGTFRHNPATVTLGKRLADTATTRGLGLARYLSSVGT